MATITNEAIDKLLENRKVNAGESNFLKDKDERYKVIVKNTSYRKLYINTKRDRLSDS